MLVCIESPYAGNVERNDIYLKYCMLDSIYNHKEKPYASHAYLPRYLDDLDPEQRKLGIQIGFEWGDQAKKRIFYTDLCWSDGMKEAKNRVTWDSVKLFYYKQKKRKPEAARRSISEIPSRM